MTRSSESDDLHIEASSEVAQGRFSNLTQVSSTPDAFVLDFSVVHDQRAWLLSRLFLSPSHTKQLHQALGQAIKRHEQRFGTVGSSPGTDRG